MLGNDSASDIAHIVAESAYAPSYAHGLLLVISKQRLKKRNPRRDGGADNPHVYNSLGCNLTEIVSHDYAVVTVAADDLAGAAQHEPLTDNTAVFDVFEFYEFVIEGCDVDLIHLVVVTARPPRKCTQVFKRTLPCVRAHVIAAVEVDVCDDAAAFHDKPSRDGGVYACGEKGDNPALSSERQPARTFDDLVIDQTALTPRLDKDLVIGICEVYTETFDGVVDLIADSRAQLLTRELFDVGASGADGKTHAAPQFSFREFRGGITERFRVIARHLGNRETDNAVNP